MSGYQSRQQYTGEEFRQIVMDDSKTNQFVGSYLVSDYESDDANIRSQIDRATTEHKPAYRHIVPNGYYTDANQGGPGANVPVYTITGPVAIEFAKLDWGVIIRRCHFTDKVELTHLDVKVWLQFSDCTFDKGLYIKSVSGVDLLLTDIKGAIYFLNH